MLARGTPAQASDYKSDILFYSNYTYTCQRPFVLAALFSYELINDHLYMCLHKSNG